MKIKINLLPPEIKARQKQRKLGRRLMLGAMVLLVAFLGFYSSLFIATLKIKNEALYIKETRLALEKEAEGFSHYLELQTQLEKAKNITETAVGKPREWPWLLREIGNSMPPALWLTDLSISRDSDNKGQAWALVFQGTTNNQGDLNWWLKELERVQDLSAVHCQYIRQASPGNASMYRFEVQALLAGLDDSKPDDSKLDDSKKESGGDGE